MRGTEIAVDKIFTKGFIRDKGTNKVPEHYAHDLRNVRIVNGGITLRNGHQKLYEKILSDGVVQSIIGTTELRFIVDNTLYTWDGTTQTEVGSVGSHEKHRIVQFGQFSIILNGEDEPYVYDGSTLSQLTATEIDTGINPSFGAKFQGYTFINNTSDRTLVRYSEPVISGTSTDAYNFKGSNSQNIQLTGILEGIVAGLNRVWFITQDSIEYIDRGSVTTTASEAYLYPTPFASGLKLASPDSAVVAGDALFMFTAGKEIKTINYAQDRIEPQLATISNREGMSIKTFLQDELAEDQSQSYMFYDSDNELVKLHVRSNVSDINDLRLIYDVNEDTRLIDYGKFFSCMTYWNGQIIAGSSTDTQLYIDEIGQYDDGADIEWYFETQPLSLKSKPHERLQYRGAYLAGQIDNIACIDREVLVDDRLVGVYQIKGNAIAPTTTIEGIAGEAVAGEPIGGAILPKASLVEFEKAIPARKLREVGKKIRFIFSGKGGNMVLDGLGITVLKRKKRFIRDRL